MRAAALATPVTAAGKGYEPPSLEAFHFKSFFDFSILGVQFHVTKIVTMMLFATLVIAIFFLAAFRHPRLVPGKLQAAGEIIYDFIRNSIAVDVIGREGVRFAPYLTTLFAFVFLNNLFGILPLAQVPVNSRIAFPAFLALISWVLFNYLGIQRKGFGPYFKEMLFPPGVPKPVYILLTPIEFVSTLFVRPFTLAVRLFANMFAGHIMLLVFISGTTYLLTVSNFSKAFAPVSFLMAIVLSVFEMLIIALQAYIFTILTAQYVSVDLAAGVANHRRKHPYDRGRRSHRQRRVPGLRSGGDRPRHRHRPDLRGVRLRRRPPAGSPWSAAADRPARVRAGRGARPHRPGHAVRLRQVGTGTSVMSLAAIPLAAENNPLIPDLGELIIGFIAFAVLVALLWKAAFPAIERVYHERTERIEGGIARADQAQQEAQRTLEQYRAQLAEARAEATRMREEARVQGQGIVEELRARAQQEAAQITARAEARIEADRQHAFAELRSEIGRLAVDLSGRIIGESLQDGDRQRRVVDRFLTDLEDAAGGAVGGASPAPPMR